MKQHLKNILDNHISLGNIIILAFMIGGFYYLTPQQIKSNSEAIAKNAADIETVQQQIQRNSLVIERIQGQYVSNKDLDDYVTRPILNDLEKLIREIQSSQDQRLNRIEERIDYLIQQNQ